MPPNVSNADTALEHAINTTGDFVGVVLVKSGGWYTFPFPTRALLDEWFLDWHNAPSESSFLAMFDKTARVWNDGLPVTSVGNFFDDLWEGVTDAADETAGLFEQTWDVFTSGGDASGPSQKLYDMITLHETYWSRVGQRNQRSQTMRTFLRDVWDPFYSRYTNLVALHGLSDVDIDVLGNLAVELDQIRSLAQSRAIPVPDLPLPAVSSGAPMSNQFVGRGPRGGGGGFRGHGGFRGPVHAPPGRPWGGHRGGGFRRHGSRFAGRWYYGWDGYPYWYEGPEVEDDQTPVPDELANKPPPSTDEQPVSAAASDGSNGGDQGGQDQGGDQDDQGDGNGATAASGWRETWQSLTSSARRENDGAPSMALIDLAQLIAPAGKGAKITLTLDGDELIGILEAGGLSYRATADLSAVLATLDTRTDQRIEAFYRALVAPKALVGVSRRLGGVGCAGDASDAPVVIGGGCGTRSYANVTKGAIALILQRLSNKGATITGSNPWYVITNNHGVEFSGTWNQAASTIDLEVTDSDFAVPCAAIWREIEDMLAEINVTPVAVLDTTPIFEAVRAAGHVLAGCLLEKHEVNVAAGWLDDIGNAFKSAGSSIARGAGSVVHTAQSALKTLKTPVTIAATAVATVYGGPQAGMAAAKLVGPVVDSVDGSGGAQQAQAQQAVAAAQQLAQTNPTMAKALGAAQKAVAHTTAAYHAANVMQRAALTGDPNATAQVKQLQQAAQGGDAGASSLLNIANKALGGLFDDRASNPQSVMSPDYQVDPSLIDIDATSSGAYAANVYPVNDVGGRKHVLMGVDPVRKAHNAAAILRSRAAGGVHEIASSRGDGVYGALLSTNGAWSFPAFDTQDGADDWMGRYSNNPGTYVYVGYFDTTDPMWPHPINDMSDARQSLHAQHAPTVASGWLGPLFAGATGFAAGFFGPDLYHYARREWDKAHAQANPAAVK